MKLAQPPWVDFAGADLYQIRYLWDDARVYADFPSPRVDITVKAIKISVRARMALAVGLYEWIVWRFNGLHRHTEPLEVLEAAWCAMADPRYLAFYEFQREEWVGPIDGPLWLAMTCLQDSLPKGYAFEGNLYRALDILYSLTAHVLPDRRLYDIWICCVLRRLVELFPVQPLDPFSDLFEQRIGEHLGPLVSRRSLDPSVNIDPKKDRSELAQILTDTAASGNRYMATPQDLRELGFVDVPYSLP